MLSLPGVGGAEGRKMSQVTHSRRIRWSPDVKHHLCVVERPDEGVVCISCYDCDDQQFGGMDAIPRILVQCANAAWGCQVVAWMRVEGVRPGHLPRPGREEASVSES